MAIFIWSLSPKHSSSRQLNQNDKEELWAKYQIKKTVCCYPSKVKYKGKTQRHIFYYAPKIPC